MFTCRAAIKAGVRRLLPASATPASTSTKLTNFSTFRPTTSVLHGGLQPPGATPTSTSYEQMNEDSRYAATGVVPEHLLKNDSDAIEERFSMGPAYEGRALYLDYQATTPIDPRVTDAMLPYMLQRFGNPHSNTHTYGWDTERACEEAREQVANLIGADPREIVFTSGATESNNIAVKGIARFYGKRKKHVIVSYTFID
jgi:hypothetical protein